MTRRYADWEVDEYVEQQQNARHDARVADPRWTMVEDDLTLALGGGVWRYKGDDMVDLVADFQAAVHRYKVALDRVDPEHEDGILGASVNQDARAAVDREVRDAAHVLLKAGRAIGRDTSNW